MTIYFVFLFIIIVIFFVIIIYINNQNKNPQSVLMLQQQLENLRQQLKEGLNQNTEALNNQLNIVTNQMLGAQKTLGERLDNNSAVIADVQKNLGALGQATERVFEVGKDIASLQEILRAPKLRGGLGELFLGDLLMQILPSANFTTQYKFKSGEAVDAVIKLGNGLVPVDSKFPLENFKRMIECQDEAEKKSSRKKFVNDVKKHVDSIAAKYILPDEGTFDFALMYIPAENIYYESIIKDDSPEESSIATYAISKKIIPVSPNSFYAYLQAIVLGLKGMRVEKDAEEILRHLARLKADFGKFKEDYELVGKHLTNVKTKYDESTRRLEKLGDKLINSDNQEKLKLE